MNDVLKKDVAEMQCGMVAVAEKIAIPECFNVEHKNNKVCITNTLNGRTVDVKLHAYKQVRTILNQLLD